MESYRYSFAFFIVLLWGSNYCVAGNSSVKLAINPLLTPSLNVELITTKHGFGIDVGTYLGGGSMIKLKAIKYKRSILKKSSSSYYGILIERYSYEASWPHEEKGTYITPMAFGGQVIPVGTLLLIGGELGFGYPIYQSIKPDDPNFKNIQVPIHIVIFIGIKIGSR